MREKKQRLSANASKLIKSNTTLHEITAVSLKFGLSKNGLYEVIHGRSSVTEKYIPALEYLITEIVKRKKNDIVELIKLMEL